MKQPNVHYVTRVVFEQGQPFIESRAKAIGDGTSALPLGKVLVSRTPILPPGASEEELSHATETRLEDDDGSSWLCEECALALPAGLQWLMNEEP
jgi:hypothetical protein